MLLALADWVGIIWKYAKPSGGIFVDCAIHDIDSLVVQGRLSDQESAGCRSNSCACRARLEQRLRQRDRDGGAFGCKIASLYCSRMMAAREEDTTEVTCGRGSLRVNMQGRKTYVEIHDSLGVKRELP